MVQRFFFGLLLAAQLVVSLFYVSAAMLMWGPFMAASLTSKAFIGAIVSVPLLSSLIASDRVRIPMIGKLAALGLTALLQVSLVFIASITSGS